MSYAHNSGIAVADIPRIKVARVHLNDWRSSYFGTTCEEEGFAWRLTCMIYDAMGALPDDDERNARAMCMDVRVYRRLKKRVIGELRKFALYSGFITQARIVREIEDYIATYRKRSQAASAREADKRLQMRSAGLPANIPQEVRQMSATSSAEVRPKSATLMAELEGDLFQKPNENNGCIATSRAGPEHNGSGTLARACVPKPKPKPRSEEKRVKSSTPAARDDPAPSPPVAREVPPGAVKAAFEAYNDLARRCGLPHADKLTKGRADAIRARLREYGAEGWLKALAMIERSKFCRGSNDRNWRAHLDFVVQASSFTKLIEGRYGNGAHASVHDPNEEAEQERLARERVLIRQLEERPG